MDVAPTQEQQQVRSLVEAICRRFDDAYWQRRDETAAFPEDFHRAIADAGLLGIAMPEADGGSGLGIAAAATMMRAIAESGAGMAGASSVHMNIFGMQPVVVFGSEGQRRRMLPPVMRGEAKLCFCVTEPDAGLDTTRLKTRAEREGDRYLL
ncbi:MAG: acyl-CoA dehydrogenase, partial [Alphaproteobacteria bacterium]|nr:acyl-CoA dehydrogenase [Alphaproteobacteria bacterium]